MSFLNHGVNTFETPTSITPPVTVANPTVFIGTAPSHRGTNQAVGVPIVAHSWASAISSLGYSDDWDKWTLCEGMDTEFRMFGVSPTVFINMFDASRTNPATGLEPLLVTSGRAFIADELAVLDTLVVTGGEAEVDYVAEYVPGGISITPLPGGTLATATTLTVAYHVVNAGSVTSADIIKGIDALDHVFPRLRMVPGLILAPGWEDNPEVAVRLFAKQHNINGIFRAMALTDVPKSVASYMDVPMWKEQSGLSGHAGVICFPRVSLGDRTYHMSTQLAGRMRRIDFNNGGVPFVSPSNQTLRMDRMTWGGDELILDINQANFLNDNGIVTSLNWIGGWRAWGNRTAIFPGSTDPKDSWIPIRRMFNWIANEILLTYWQRVSMPIQAVLIDNIVSSLNLRFDGLTSQGFILGGRVEWHPEQNPATDIMNGIIRFHVSVCPPVPAQQIDFWLEFDPSYFETLASNIG